VSGNKIDDKTYEHGGGELGNGEAERVGAVDDVL
jgi:hypothetical protein